MTLGQLTVLCFGILILARCLNRNTQVIIGTVMIVVALLAAFGSRLVGAIG